LGVGEGITGFSLSLTLAVASFVSNTSFSDMSSFSFLADSLQLIADSEAYLAADRSHLIVGELQFQ
jgi:hypothetical protein